MRNFLKCLLCAVIVSTVVVACAPGGAEPIRWEHDFAAARAEAATSHKILVVDFMADWCGPCREMGETTWRDPKVVAAMDKFIPVQLNVDNNREIAERYGVNGIPMVALMDADGHILKSFVGGKSAGEVLDFLK